MQGTYSTRYVCTGVIDVHRPWTSITYISSRERSTVVAADALRSNIWMLIKYPLFIFHRKHTSMNASKYMVATRNI